MKTNGVGLVMKRVSRKSEQARPQITIMERKRKAGGNVTARGVSKLPANGAATTRASCVASAPRRRATTGTKLMTHAKKNPTRSDAARSRLKL